MPPTISAHPVITVESTQKTGVIRNPRPDAVGQLPANHCWAVEPVTGRVGNRVRVVRSSVLPPKLHETRA